LAARRRWRFVIGVLVLSSNRTRAHAGSNGGLVGLLCSPGPPCGCRCPHRGRVWGDPQQRGVIVGDVRACQGRAFVAASSQSSVQERQRITAPTTDSRHRNGSNRILFIFPRAAIRSTSESSRKHKLARDHGTGARAGAAPAST
jgi:hypothetical protein